MGGWKLEVFKMSLYMMFPVGIFYYFNQPQYFEKWVVKVRREIYPPENVKAKLDIEKCINEYSNKRNKRLFEALSESK